MGDKQFEELVERVGEDLARQIRRDIESASDEDNAELRAAAKHFLKVINKLEDEFNEILSASRIAEKKYQEAIRNQTLRHQKTVQQYFYLTKLASDTFQKAQELIKNSNIADRLFYEVDRFRAKVFQVLGRKLVVFVIADEEGTILEEDLTDKKSSMWQATFDKKGTLTGRLSNTSLSKQKMKNILNNVNKYGSALGDNQKKAEENFKNVQEVYKQAKYRWEYPGKKTHRVMWLTPNGVPKKWGLAHFQNLGPLDEIYVNAVFSQDYHRIAKNNKNMHYKIHYLFDMFGANPDSRAGTFAEDVNFIGANGQQFSASVKGLRAETMSFTELTIVAEKISKEKTFSSRQLAELEKEMAVKVKPAISITFTNNDRKIDKEIRDIFANSDVLLNV